MTVRVGAQLHPQQASYAQMRDAWLRIEDGMVKEIWSEMSDLQIVMQLGAFPVLEEER
jgi:hypothetical protein